jgi:hypothetical protein
LPVRYGAAGQSKKLAVSSPAFDELSFKSDSTVDCGGERVGQRVAKDLDGVTIFGTITEYDGKDSPEIWRVQYDDGSTNRQYYHREELVEALLHYRIHEKDDPNNNSNAIYNAATPPDDIYSAGAPSFDEQSQQPSEESDDQSTRKARDKKRRRNERRLQRTAKRPAIHRPSAALIPLSQVMDRPVWQFS